MQKERPAPRLILSVDPLDAEDLQKQIETIGDTLQFADGPQPENDLHPDPAAIAQDVRALTMRVEELERLVKMFVFDFGTADANKRR